jgi:hypothetical protein
MVWVMAIPSATMNWTRSNPLDCVDCVIKILKPGVSESCRHPVLLFMPLVVRVVGTYLAFGLQFCKLIPIPILLFYLIKWTKLFLCTVIYCILPAWTLDWFWKLLSRDSWSWVYSPGAFSNQLLIIHPFVDDSSSIWSIIPEFVVSP